MPMYNLIEYSDNYSKISASLWQYYMDEPVLDDNGTVVDFPVGKNNSASFRLKTKIASRTGNDGIKNVEIMVPLKYLSNFWRYLEMPLINCEIKEEKSKSALFLLNLFIAEKRSLQGSFFKFLSLLNSCCAWYYRKIFLT